MFGTQDTKKASGQKLLDTINTACVVAQTSHGAFNSVVSKLFTDHVFKSIISENPKDRSSISLRKAFAPVVKYTRFLQDILQDKGFLDANIDIDQGQSFFRIFDKITQSLSGRIYAIPRLLKSNIAELVPLFFFKAQLQHRLLPYPSALWLNRYQQKPLPLDYNKGVESMVRSVDPENVREELAFIANDNVDLLAHNLLDIQENRIENIGTTALYKTYQLFIDRIFQTGEFSHIFAEAPQWLKNDPNFMRRAIGQNVESLLSGSMEIQHSRELVTQALQQDPLLIHRLPQEYLNDREHVLTAVQGWGTLLRRMPKQFQQDFGVVLEAVKSDMCAAQDAHEDLKNDEKFVLEALQWYNKDLDVYPIPRALKGNADFILKAGRIHKNHLYDASIELQNNKKFLLEAARIYPIFLQRSSAEMRTDQDFMDAARLINPYFQ